MNIKKIRPPIIFIAVLIFFSSLHLIYAIRTNNYFSVDDFQVLAYFKTHTVVQMIPDFFLHGDIFGYRKIMGYIVFGELFKNFGVDPSYFVSTLFLFHTTNLILLFLIVKHLVKNDFIALFVSVIFNKFYLFYFSNVHEVLAGFFSLLSIYLFFKLPKKIYFSIAAYIFALLSKELAYSLPFFLLAYTYISGSGKRKTIPYFVILGIFILFQGQLMYAGRFTSFVSSYGATLSFGNLVSSFNFYFSPLLIGFLVLLALFTKKYKPLGILAVSLITILPVLFFGARREIYYLYVPMIYFLIYLSLLLPKLSLKTSFIYLVVILFFGGRAAFPIIARQNYPNWQKVSIQNVVNAVEKGLKDGPATAKVSLTGINLERDANLMLQHGVVDLFTDKSVSAKYDLVYNQDAISVIATRK